MGTDRSWRRGRCNRRRNIQSRASFDPPADAFGWPPAAESGSGREVALRGRQMTSGPSSPSTSSSSSATATGAAPASSARSAEHSNDATPTDERPYARIAIRGADVFKSIAVARSTLRARSIRTALPVLSSGSTWRFEGPSTKANFGSLVTDQDGAFDGNLYLPLAFPVGDYEVVAVDPGRRSLRSWKHAFELISSAELVSSSWMRFCFVEGTGIVDFPEAYRHQGRCDRTRWNPPFGDAAGHERASSSCTEAACCSTRARLVPGYCNA